MIIIHKIKETYFFLSFNSNLDFKKNLLLLINVENQNEFHGTYLKKEKKIS